MSDERRILDITDTVIRIDEMGRSGYGDDPGRLYAKVSFRVPSEHVETFVRQLCEEMARQERDDRL